MCGKNLPFIIPSLQTAGSPPRVREKPSPFSALPANAGITPACAGKTPVFFCVSYIYQDHPRVCGKNVTDVVKDPVGSGSPPRVREKLLVLSEISLIPRITPACAGKTLASRYRRHLPRDHPRVCGKNSSREWHSSNALGSPPRVREKLI